MKKLLMFLISIVIVLISIAIGVSKERNSKIAESTVSKEEEFEEHPAMPFHGNYLTHSYVYYNEDKSVTFGITTFGHKKITFESEDINKLMKIFKIGDEMAKYCESNSKVDEIEKEIGMVSGYKFIYKFSVRENTSTLHGYEDLKKLTGDTRKYLKFHDIIIYLSSNVKKNDYDYYENVIMVDNMKHKFVDLLTIERDRYYTDMEEYREKLKQYNARQEQLKSEIDVVLNKMIK